MSSGTPTIIVSHIPPFGDQFDAASTNMHRSTTAKYNVPLSIHGHVHEYAYSRYYNDETRYLVAPSIDKRQLIIVSFEGDDFQVIKEPF